MSRIPLLSLAGVVALAVSAPAYSKTYYVDSLNGNDAWSGELASPTSANGPWRSFSNLAIANKLAPGDNVLLRCGGKWSETLTLNVSGTAAAPIRIGAYPEPCGEKPAIDGAKRIPASAWSLHAGNIYKAKLLDTLIPNGTFSSSTAGWGLWSQNNDATMAITATCPSSTAACLAFKGGAVGSSLLISTPFPLESSIRYRVTFSVLAPLGSRYGAFIRRYTSPWDTLGLAASLTGTGAWQTISLPFTATTTLNNARLDIQLQQPGITAHVKDVRVALDAASAPATLIGITQNGIAQQVAHYPNRGYNTTLPDSPYLVTASPSTTITKADGSKGSAYLVGGSDLLVTPQPGSRLVLRNTPWSHSEHTITSVSGKQIFLDPATSAPLTEAGWGYYLTGSLWMLDSPGEWHYDASTQTLYMWPAAGGAPGDAISYTSLNVGLDINRKQHIVIDGVAIRNVRDAVYAQRSVNASLQRVQIANTARYGIDGEGMINFELSNSQISFTGSDALYGPASLGSIVRDNDMAYNGVVLDSAGKPANLPLPSFGAIRTGASARIIGNRLQGLASIGIAAGSGSEVSDNAITGYCYLVNDCAGIYFPGANGGLVTGNLVTGGVGNRLGIPPLYNTSLANGLYLDLWTSNVIATDNIFAGGDYGIQLHNGFENQIQRNQVYGGRGNALWLQETANDKRVAGNIYGNAISDNAFFSTTMIPAVRQSAAVEHTADFATYQGNVYSSLLSTTMAQEAAPSGSRTYQLADWQSAKDASGAPRNLDLQARIAAPLDAFASGVLGNTLIANGNFVNGTTGWMPYNAVSPYATVTLDNCGTFAPKCLRLNAGGSKSLVSSPRFGVTQGQWYRVSFDAQLSTPGQTFRVKAIQAAGSYAGIMNIDQLILDGPTSLKRHAFIFQSLATVPLSSTSAGARVDFMDIQPGQTLRLANFEIVPITMNAGAVRHALLANPGRSTINAACPSEVTAPAECSNYYAFPQGEKVVWPVTLPPLAGQVVFSQSATLPDADGDGVADSQDSCPATVPGNATNAKGCALGQ